MKKAAAHTNTVQQHHRITAIAPVLFATAWRIVLPVAVFSAVGALADSYFGTKPWLALLGLMAGFVVAGVLVKRQASAAPTDEL